MARDVQTVRWKGHATTQAEMRRWAAVLGVSQNEFTVSAVAAQIVEQRRRRPAEAAVIARQLSEERNHDV